MDRKQREAKKKECGLLDRENQRVGEVRERVHELEGMK